MITIFSCLNSLHSYNYVKDHCVYIGFVWCGFECALYDYIIAIKAQKKSRKNSKQIWKTEARQKNPHKHNDIHCKIIIRHRQQQQPLNTFSIDIALYLLAWSAKRDHKHKTTNVLLSFFVVVVVVTFIVFLYFMPWPALCNSYAGIERSWMKYIHKVVKFIVASFVLVSLLTSSSNSIMM